MSVVKIAAAKLRAQQSAASEAPPEDAAPSWQSRCINSLLWFLPIKKQLATAAAVREDVRKRASKPASHAPTGLGRGIEVSLEKSAAGWPVYHVAPSAYPGARNCVVFLHGGGYYKEIVRAHWRFVAYLARQARVRCIVPIYPLVPHATANDIVPAAGELLRRLLREAGPAKLTVIGNSAGAGLALAAAQWLRDGGHGQPDELVLISPGVDATVSRPEQAAIAAADPTQAIAGVAETGRLYAGALDIAHPYVSPLNGSFRGLAPLTVFSGTRDLLYPDSVALAAKARAAGVPVELHLRRGQAHNYAAMPTPEGRQAREAILRVIARGALGDASCAPGAE